MTHPRESSRQHKPAYSLDRRTPSLHAFRRDVHLLPPSLRAAVPVMKPAALSEALALFSGAHTTREKFRVYLDEACGMPTDWTDRWRTWRSPSKARTASESKYIADAYIFHMLASSPFRERDWRLADASVVVLMPREFGGAGLAPERCRRKLARESEAWRSTNGTRHFFILTSDRGPCCNGGQLINTAFLQHHVIGHHGELDGHHWRHGIAPDIACFHSHKDISIPTANAFMPSLASWNNGTRDLLVFYAGSGATWDTNTRRPTPGMREGRKLLHQYWGNATANADIRVYHKISPTAYSAAIGNAKFCPIMGGYAPWTPRLSEAILNGCVPVFFSSLLPPFSRILNWTRFSVRVPSLHNIPHLRFILEQQNYSELSSHLAAVSQALWFRLQGGYQGDDMLPFLILEMSLVLRDARARPLKNLVPEILGDVPASPRPLRRWSSKDPNTSFYYEGQTVVRTFHGEVERTWDCAYLTHGHHPQHAENPEETYEVGNMSRTVQVVSADCVCIRANAISAEPVSPTQRDMGPASCTSPCAQLGRVAAFDPAAAWCGPDAYSSIRTPCRSCVTRNCTLYSGVAEGPWHRLSQKTYSFLVEQ